MGQVARTAFVTLVMSAKLHKVLDKMREFNAKHHARRVRSFDRELDATLKDLELDTGVIGDEARKVELEMIAHDLADVEELYRAWVRKGGLSSETAQRFEKMIASLRHRLNEKLV